MKILFDFDLFNDPNLDAQLFDIMVAVKTEVDALLSAHRKLITDKNAAVIVSIRPKEVSLQYQYESDQTSAPLVRELLKNVDWKRILSRHARTVLN